MKPFLILLLFLLIVPSFSELPPKGPRPFAPLGHYKREWETSFEGPSSWPKDYSAISRIPQNASFMFINTTITRAMIQPAGRSLCFGVAGSYEAWVQEQVNGLRGPQEKRETKREGPRRQQQQQDEEVQEQLEDNEGFERNGQRRGRGGQGPRRQQQQHQDEEAQEQLEDQEGFERKGQRRGRGGRGGQGPRRQQGQEQEQEQEQEVQDQEGFERNGQRRGRGGQGPRRQQQQHQDERAQEQLGDQEGFERKGQRRGRGGQGPRRQQQRDEDEDREEVREQPDDQEGPQRRKKRRGPLREQQQQNNSRQGPRRGNQTMPRRPHLPRKPRIERYCLPNFIIAGMPKGGTSALFYYLCKHPLIDCGRKELPPITDNAIASLPGWVPSNKITGAMWWRLTEEVVHFAQPRVLLIFRRPTDWIYSIFNFFCNPQLGETCQKGEWADKDMRSPERFHALITGENCTTIPSKDCPIRSPTYLQRIKALSNLVGRENIHIISSEKMYRDGYSTITETFQFIGLEPFGVPEDYTEAINTNDNRGVNSVSSHANGLGATVRPLSEETIRILREKINYEQLVKDMTEETGINFREYWD